MEKSIKKGMNWLYGYFDAEYLRQINLKQIEKAIGIGINDSREEIVEKVEKFVFRMIQYDNSPSEQNEWEQEWKKVKDSFSHKKEQNEFRK